MTDRPGPSSSPGLHMGAGGAQPASKGQRQQSVPGAAGDGDQPSTVRTPLVSTARLISPVKLLLRACGYRYHPLQQNKRTGSLETRMQLERVRAGGLPRVTIGTDGTSASKLRALGGHVPPPRPPSSPPS